MGSAVAYEEVEASIQALRYGGGEDAASGTVYGILHTGCVVYSKPVLHFTIVLFV